MLTHASNLTKAAGYYGLALALGVVAAVFAVRGAEIAVILYMFTPLLAVLAMQLILTRDGRSFAGWRQLGLHRLGNSWRPWLVALLLPPLLVGAVWVGTLVTGVGHYKPMAGYADAPALITSILLEGILGGSIFAFGEEIGWRGYLLPKLATLGLLPAMLFSGFLHGAWHLPIILGTPFYHAAGSPWIVVPEFMAVLTMAGVFYGYIRHLSGSVWPAVVGHATFNESLNRFGGITKADDPALLEYVGGESGVLMIIATLAIVTLMWRRWPATATAEM